MKNTLILTAMLFVVSGGFSQTTRYVKPTASGSGNGTSWSNASADLQAMIYASNSGDQVFVAAGIYQPAIGQSFALKEGVKVYGHFAGTESSLSQRNLSGVDTSFLEANGAYVMYNNAGITPASILNGFCLRYAFRLNVNGACLYNNHASPTIKNCIFYNNETDNGGGAIINDQCAPIISHCIFRNNTAVAGGAVFNYISNAKFLNCLFYDNYSSGSGGAVSNHTSYPSFINCTIVHNQAIQGSAINNYIPANTPNTQPVIITNCIVWDNFGSPASVINNDGSFPTTIVTYSNTQVPFAGTGNISADPSFVNAPMGNYELQFVSLGINIGNNDAAILSEIDFDLSGGARIQRCDVDMGAYEFHEYSSHKIFVKPTVSGQGDGSSWANAMNNLQLAINLSCVDDSVFVAGGIYPRPIGQSFSMKEGVKIYGHFSGTESTLAERDLMSIDTSFLVSNANNNTIINNYTNGLTIASVLDGFTIMSTFQVNFNRGIENNYASPLIRNILFYNLGSGAVYNNRCSPVFRNDIFLKNASHDGGAIYSLASDVDIENCYFEKNLASYGGAIAILGVGPNQVYQIGNSVFLENRSIAVGGGIHLLEGRLNIDKCKFMKNEADDYGGVIFSNNSHDINISNSLFALNHSSYGGAIWSYAPPVNIMNSTIAFNSGTSACDALGVNTFTFINTILWGNSGIGGIQSEYADVSIGRGIKVNCLSSADGLDPMFVADSVDFRLSPCSPAINAGNNAYATSTDLVGGPRIVNNFVDLGPYESSWQPPISINNFGYPKLTQAVSAAAQSGGTVEIGPCAIESPSITIPMNVLLNIALGGSLTIVP